MVFFKNIKHFINTNIQLNIATHLIRKIKSLLESDFRKFPALFVVAPVIAGILSGYYFLKDLFPAGHFLSLSLQVLLITSGVIFYLKSLKMITFYIFLFITAAGVGLLRFSDAYNSYGDNTIANVIKTGDKSVKTFGTTMEPPDINDNRVKLVIHADSMIVFNKTVKTNTNIIATVYKVKFTEPFIKNLTYGDYISIEGEPEPLSHRKNPGEFDYGEYLRLHGIDGQMVSFGYNKVSFISSTDKNYLKKNIIYPVKRYTLNVIDKYIGDDCGEFMKGLVLGERSNLSKEIKENFVNDGISHIIAVSGLNVAYVIIIITLVLQIFPIRNVIKIGISILILIFYMYLTGSVPSIVRATIMACVYLVSLLFERKTNSVNLVSFAALVIVLADPRQLFDAGFILSFWAILSLMIIYPRLYEILKGRRIYKVIISYKYLSKSFQAAAILVIGTLAAQIGTLPITALMFKKISMVSLVTNLIAIPVSNLSMAMGFLLVLVSLISPWLASIVGVTSGYILSLLLKFIDFFAHLNFSFIETYNIGLFFLFCFYAIVYFLIFSRNMAVFTRVLISILIVTNYFVYKSALNDKDMLKICFLDIGNSGACLFTLPSEHSVLINCGTSSAKYSTAERNIIPFLKTNGISRLDYLVITSANKDEFRNILLFVRQFDVKNLVTGSYNKILFEDPGMKNYFNGVSFIYIDSSFSIKDIADARLYLVPDKTSPSNLFVNFVYGSQQYIFDDSKYGSQKSELILFNGMQPAVFKVPSPGTFDFTCPELISKINPLNVIIYAAKEYKRYNSDIFISTVKQSGTNVLTTSNGALIFESNGDETDRIFWK